MYEMPSEQLMAFVTTIKSYDLLKCCKIIHVVMDLLSCRSNLLKAVVVVFNYTIIKRISGKLTVRSLSFPNT